MICKALLLLIIFMFYNIGVTQSQELIIGCTMNHGNAETFKNLNFMYLVSFNFWGNIIDVYHHETKINVFFKLSDFSDVDKQLKSFLDMITYLVIKSENKNFFELITEDYSPFTKVLFDSNNESFIKSFKNFEVVQSFIVKSVDINEIFKDTFAYNTYKRYDTVVKFKKTEDCKMIKDFTWNKVKLYKKGEHNPICDIKKYYSEINSIPAFRQRDEGYNFHPLFPFGKIPDVRTAKTYKKLIEPFLSLKPTGTMDYNMIAIPIPPEVVLNKIFMRCLIPIDLNGLLFLSAVKSNIESNSKESLEYIVESRKIIDTFNK